MQGTIIGGGAEILVDAFEATALDAYLDCISNLYVLSRIKAIDVDGSSVYERSYTATTGTLTGDPLPPQVSAEILKKSGVGGRKGNGRMYMPVANELAQNGGLLDASYVTLLTTFTTAAKTVSGGTPSKDFELGVYTTADGDFSPTASFRIVQYFRTQRRRTFGFGS
jgi:hypothetical protein